jgi:hypothetical protein
MGIGASGVGNLAIIIIDGNPISTSAIDVIACCP